MEDKIAHQRQLIEKGNPTIELVSPCRIDNGIRGFDEVEKQFYHQIFEKASRQKNIAFFIPASGSGSRMFGAIYDYLNNKNPDEDTIEFIEHLLNSIKDFAFYNRLPQPVKDDIKSGDIDIYAFLKLLLYEEGFNFGNLPKGLIPFHRYGNFIINPFQEHILQGTKIGGERTAFHFTIQKEFEEQIRKSIKILREITGIDFSFHFSVQDSETDSIAFRENFAPLKNDKEAIVTRPGGHGALLGNLNAIDTDLIFIRNIDNIQHQDASNQSIEDRKVLGGLLIKFQEKVHEILRKLDLDENIQNEIASINETFDLRIDENLIHDHEAIRNYFNRPIRVCGMVKNEGQPGGGPFWVKDMNGTISRQIIEKSQISNAHGQIEIVIKSTHFNPVEIVCGVRDYKGQKFNLIDYRNESLYFIVEKQHEGQSIMYIEQPGLWNGGMEDWITLFIEIESECFSPVKTVLDLLKPLHQGKDQHLH